MSHSAAAAVPPRVLSALGRPSAWQLDGQWAFLNHGSFGARPRAVTAAQHRYQAAFEAHPIRFLDDECVMPRLHAARKAIAAFLKTDPAGLVFVANVTDAIASILASVPWKRGDALLTTSHAYGAVRRAVEATCARNGVNEIVVSLPCPIQGHDQVEAAILAALTPRTRVAIIDQITSPTALRFDVDRLTRLLRRRGVQVLVDGAHAPGMLPRPVTPGATWWTGNLHKWGLAPLGCGVLVTASAARRFTRPVALSHMHFDGYQPAFDWQGTRDISPWLSAVDAIAWVKAGEGWTALRRYNAALARWAGAWLADRWGTQVAGPPAMRTGLSMATVQLPAHARRWKRPNALRDALAEHFKVEVPIWNDGPNWWMRIAAQAYVRPAHVKRCAAGVEALCTE